MKFATENHDSSGINEQGAVLVGNIRSVMVLRWSVDKLGLGSQGFLTGVSASDSPRKPRKPSMATRPSTNPFISAANDTVSPFPYRSGILEL